MIKNTLVHASRVLIVRREKTAFYPTILAIFPNASGFRDDASSAPQHGCESRE